MVRPHNLAPISRLVLALILASGPLPGCGIVPRSRMEESRKLSQLLRTENARLKDQVLALQGQNRDLSDRAVDDLQRLTAREQAIEGLERSVQAYQDDRERLAAAYEQLTASLGRRPDAPKPARTEGLPGLRRRGMGASPPNPGMRFPRPFRDGTTKRRIGKPSLLKNLEPALD